MALDTPAPLRPARLSWWIVAAMLFGIELAITALIFFPRANEAYEAFYVTQAAPCYLENGLPRVEMGRIVGGTERYAINRCLFDENWSTRHSWGTVLNGPAGRLTFRLAEVPAGDLRVSFVAAANGRFAAPAITVSAGGMVVGRMQLSRAPDRVYSVIVPRSAVIGDRLDLAFRVAGPARGPLHRRFGLLRWRIDPAVAPPVATLPKPGYF